MSPSATVTPSLAPEEISALCEALEGYLALDVGGRGQHEALYGLFVSWEWGGRG